MTTAAEPKRRIAFVVIGVNSHTNEQVRRQLVRVFPEYEVEEIDIVAELIKRERRVVWWNLVHVFRMYWRRILARREGMWQCFYRTPYSFHRIKAFIEQRLGARRHEYVFTFQMQSLCDASVRGLPHFVYTDHAHLANLYFPGFDRRDLFSPKWVDLERESYHRADRVFTMSSHVSRSLGEHYGMPAEKIACVYGGSNVAVPEPEESDLSVESDTSSDNAGPRILFVGVYWERKGGPDLLQAFETVRRECPSARLIIVGCAPEVGGAVNVEVVGRVPLDEVPAQYRRADIFCLPTRIEPFGIAVLEAFHHGLPVVGTNVGALPDLILPGQTGYMVDPGDVAGLASHLLDLAKNPERRRAFGAAGRQRVAERYTWEAVGDALGREIRAALGHAGHDEAHR